MTKEEAKILILVGLACGSPMETQKQKKEVAETLADIYMQVTYSICPICSKEKKIGYDSCEPYCENCGKT